MDFMDPSPSNESFTRKEFVIDSPIDSRSSSNYDGYYNNHSRPENDSEILKPGADLSFQRYGSMQSIPENEIHISDESNSKNNALELFEPPPYSFPPESIQSDGIDYRSNHFKQQKHSDISKSQRTLGGESAVTENSADFFEAVSKGDKSLVQKALENPSFDPDRKTKIQSRTSLHLAAGYGQFPVVEELLHAGADPAAKSSNGRTPLHEASQGGHDRVLLLLSDYTRDVNSQDDDGKSPCHLAAYNGEVKCIEILLDKGAQLVLKDKQGRQPAHYACMRNHRNVLEFLYDKGVDLSCRDSHGKLPVHYAAQYGSLDCLICLVERECDITLPDDAENLPIHFAAQRDHLDILRFLIKQGTSMEVCQGEKRTAAHIAAANGSHKVLHWLCDKGCNVNALDKYLNLPIHLAGETGKAKCFNCLLQHDSNLAAVNNRNETPLDTAKKMGHKLVIEKAMKNELPCPICKQQFVYEQWEEQVAPPPVVRTVSRMASTAFTSPLPKQEKTPIEISAEQRKKKMQQSKKKLPIKQSAALSDWEKLSNSATKSIFSYQKEQEAAKKKMPKRDLPAKYFGDYLPAKDIFKYKA